jgi:hypothetical protein
MRTPETLDKFQKVEDVEKQLFYHFKNNFRETIPEVILNEFEIAVKQLTPSEFVDYFNFYKYGLDKRDSP